MCTVTFIARERGYYLGMNRDEKRARPAGLPPRKTVVNGRAVLCPTEPGGGTWIALNDRGVCLALINWYSVPGKVDRDRVSRGEVVKAASAADAPDCAQATLNRLPLQRIHPFRLIGIFPRSRQIVEWRWDLRRLVRERRPWATQQWISSGFDEATAQQRRGETFRRALRESSAHGLDWLRRLHSSHAPEPGPFSACMHRADAATVSYTEISVASRGATLRYHPGAPCEVLSGLREPPGSPCMQHD